MYLCIIQNFLHSFFLYWCKCDNCGFKCRGTLTNTSVHIIIPCACRALSLTRTLYHLHAQSSHGQNCPCVCVCVCLRASVGVCHFAISLCFVRRAAMFIQWFSISLQKRFFFSFLPAIPKMSRTGLSVLKHNKWTPHLLVPAVRMLLLLFVTSADVRRMWFVFASALLLAFFCV